MLRRLRIPNPILNKSEITYLNSDYTSGTSLDVISNQFIEATNIGVLGKVGEEKTEARDVSSISGTSTVVVSSAYNQDHNKGTSLYISPWDKISIERQLTSSGDWGVYEVITIEWDKNETLYDDLGGTSQHNYRFRFYNSINGLYSEYSPTLSGAGFTRNQVGRMILNVRKNVRDPNRERVADQRIIELLNDGQDVITGIRYDWWFLKVDTYETSNGIATVADQRRYDLSVYDRFNYLHRIRYLYAPNSRNVLYDLIPKPDEEFDRYMQDVSRTSDDNILYYKQSPPDSSSEVGYFVTWPSASSTGGTFYPIYFKKFRLLSDVSDTTDLPFPQILEDYASWILHQNLGNDTDATTYKNRFFGNAPRSQDQQEITGIMLLHNYQKNKNMPTNYPRSLWRYGGGGRNKNYYGNGLISSDYRKEKFF